MTSIGELQRQVDEALEAVISTLPATVSVLAAELGRAAAPARPDDMGAPRLFSAFHLPDAQRAKVLAAEWMQIAEEARARDGDGVGDENGMAEGVAAALGAAGEAVAGMAADPKQDPELARHAIKLFLTHYRHGLPLRIKGLEARAPWLILPSRESAAGAAAANPEERLLWLREDPKLNEHHEHWHVVYPISGVPAPGNPRGGVTKDRQGELFLYMHRQMLARYDTERLAVSLGRVVAWGYPDVEPWGYDPGPYLRSIFGPREPGRSWEITQEGVSPNVVMVSVQDMAERGRRLFEAAKSGYFAIPGTPAIAVDATLLGQTQEADIGTVETGVLPWNPAGSEAEIHPVVQRPDSRLLRQFPQRRPRHVLPP